MAYYDKDDERRDILRFLSARRYATGEELTLVQDSESPDFICARADGTNVGVEITRIEYNPERKEMLEACRNYDPDLDNFAIFWAAAAAIAKKESKRIKAHWKHPDATILVLDLPEGFRFEDWPSDDSFSAEFAESGFIEVWVSDHSTLETHGEVTAIGLYPAAIWGINVQDYLGRPPYK